MARIIRSASYPPRSGSPRSSRIRSGGESRTCCSAVHGAGPARHRVPAFGECPDQGGADGRVVLHQQQLRHEMTVSTFTRRQTHISQPAVARAASLGTVLPALNHACATLGHVHMRVLAGLGAWLLGVGAATAGSLLAVSLLGQGIAASTSQQLTSAAVNNALAAEASEEQGADSATAGSPGPSPSATRSDQAQPYRRQPEAGVTPPGEGTARRQQIPARVLGRRPSDRERHAELDRAHLGGRHRGRRLPSGRCVPGVVEPDPGL